MLAMPSVRRVRAVLGSLLLVGSLTVAARPASADQPGECHVIDVAFQPEKRADLATSSPAKSRPPQIVVWVEDAEGNFKDTLFITQQTGTYGLGNRPGRADFNSYPNWPYGSRKNVFPVWAHKKIPVEFDAIEFQNGEENNLSHPFNQSSREGHYCRPMQTTGIDKSAADAISCASPNMVFTDKGVRSTTKKSNYPPRQDIVRAPGMDSATVDTFNDMNPFDAISQATPAVGQLAAVSWPIPQDLPAGEYVVWVEVSAEFDHNDTYSVAAYPAPLGIPWTEYGEPYRGQPSVLYKVPFTISTVETTATATAYAGYGDPDGDSGAMHAPDATITTGVTGSGEGRLALVTGAAGDFRVRVVARPEFDFVLPSDPAELRVDSTGSRSASVSFIAPGDDGMVGKVKGYDVRYRVGGDPITADNFGADDTLAYPNAPVPGDPGTLQSFELTGLLPQTTYTIAVRAFDDCHNTSAIQTTTFTTPDRAVGEVDACFVATAAYGSALAADVTMLRHMRDSVLRKTVLGELAVEAYYTFGPAVAGVVGESDVLRFTAREILAPIVTYVRAFRF